jgi:UDP-GlcNAc:undecaprenyl-phosphate/decaprenyl-phosphate GlcNAc-1-phosphate transferase
MISYLALFLVAVLFSLLSTGCVMKWATRKGWVDKPDSSRKLHATPIPRVGGIAIFLSIILSLGCLCLLPTVIASHFRTQLFSTGKLLAVSGMMLLIGLWDDLKNLKPWTKFAAQILVALIAWSMGYRILASWSSEGTIFSLGMLSLPLTVLWIVGITNAFNLIDGMDGLSAGAALFATASMLVPSFNEGFILSPIMLLALAGSIVGFLRFNFSPASIFLGDSGSFLLGSMLSLMAVEYSYKSTAAFAIGVPIVALGLPVLDTLMVILRRFLNGKPIFLGDRRHIHHILVERGFKPRNAVIVLYGVCGLFGMFSLLFLNPSGKAIGIVLVMLGSCICVGVQQLHCSEFKELLGYIVRGMRYQRRFLIGNVVAGKMIDGFYGARCLSGILSSLSTFLDEMEFSCAEVRVPRTDEQCADMNLKNWIVTADGPFHCLYRWTARPRKESDAGQMVAAAEEKRDPKGLSTHFRLEFVFNVPNLSSREALPFEDFQGMDVGRLTFYHPTTARLPVSAVCLLSRQVWEEFGNAVNRIMASPPEKSKTQPDAIDSPIPPLAHDRPAPERMAFHWSAPFKNRMARAHHRR